MKILVVDDSAAMRMMVKRMLRMVGMDVSDIIEATDGAEALEMVREEEPDLVLSDWNMPNMTGMEFLQALNEEDIKPDFGFITTEASAEMKSQALEAGAEFLISKPFTESSFEEALEDYI